VHREWRERAKTERGVGKAGKDGDGLRWGGETARPQEMVMVGEKGWTGKELPNAVVATSD
jgi:hypothetical protein